MNNKFRKIISFLFVLTWMFPLCFSTFLTIKKLEIRHWMKEELKIRKLETIVLAEGEVKWVDKHEIWVNNRMFDISQKKLEKGIYTFTGLYDDEETELLQKEKKSGEPESNLLLSRLFNCMQNIFYQFPVYENTLFISSPLLLIKNTQQPFYTFKEVITPPPKADLSA